MGKGLLWATCLTVSLAYGYDIELPRQTDGSQLLAVEELKHHLSLAANEVPQRFVFARPPDAAEPEAFESRYRVDGLTVWFWGDDSGPDELWDWGDNRGRESMKRNGTLFAVELFAARELGMRFVWPGEDGIVVRRVPTLKLAAKAEGSFVSTLAKGRIRNYRDYAPISWKEADGCNMPAELYFDATDVASYDERWIWQKRNLLQDREFFQYGHAFTDWGARFGKTHPEYLNLHVDAATGREERGWIGNGLPHHVKLCVSNEAVVDQIVSDWLKAGTNRFLNVCENDSIGWCECPNCRALDGVPSTSADVAANKVPMADRYVNLWNRIARKARVYRKDVMVTSYVYSSYRYPPLRERVEFPDNILCGFVCGATEDAEGMVRRWNEVGLRHLFFRPNHLHNVSALHSGRDRFYFDQAHRLMKMGMIGCDYDANNNRPTQALDFYVLARAFADPTAKFEDVVDDYCSAYGKAAPEVKAYYASVRTTAEAVLAEALKSRQESPDHSVFFEKGLPQFMHYGLDEGKMTADWNVLTKSLTDHRAAGDLSGIETTRLENLALQAEHAIVTFRFLSAMELPLDELKARAQALQDFRIRHRRDLTNVYRHLYARSWAEARYWWHYMGRVQKGK